ncbi:MAG: precorrin-6B methylase [Ruminiclostridium sp.]|nr:precorrin-6B methylase [Ruminiclostridium sp.]
MSIFNNESILAWLKYFSDNTDIDLAATRILDITGDNKNLMATVQTNKSVLVFTDGNHPEVFYNMWDNGLGDCEVWYNEGSEPEGKMKHNLLSEMIDRGVNVSAAMLIVNPDARTTYRTGIDNSLFSPGSIRYVAPEIRAVIMNKLDLDEGDNICVVSGESIAVEAAIAARCGKVVAVEYKDGDFQTMEENVLRFGLRNVSIVSDMEGWSSKWPVPDVAFLVASPKLDMELQTLVAVNPRIRVVIYTLEFNYMSRIPGMLWDNGIHPTEIMQLEVSKVGRRDEIEVQPAPWIFSGQAGGEED